MTVTIHVTQDDLVDTRFAYNPLVELTVSYHVLVNPDYHHLYRRWVEEARRTLSGIELPFMDAMIAGGRDGSEKCAYVPDFMTPTPRVVQLSLEYELEQLLATPVDLVRKNVQKLIELAGESEIRLYFLAYPHEALYCLVEELRLYWRRVLEHHWNRLTAVLDGDVLYRARQMALHGPEQMLSELNPDLHYNGCILEIRKPDRFGDFSLTGDGLQLVPTVFGGPSLHWQIEPEWTPMLIYGARGVGLWDQSIPERNESLEIALGEGRARVLQILATPANTGEIARRLHMTAGAASQHLSRLNQAGLVEPHRNGRRVYYHLTDRGAQLLTLFNRVS